MAAAAPQIIALRGEYDIYNQPALEDALAPACLMPQVIVDFSDVRYIDSTALSVLVRMRKERAKCGYEPARFAGLHRNLKLILRVSGLEHVWPQFDTVEDALGTVAKTA